jgi:hypothetical protein
LLITYLLSFSTNIFDYLCHGPAGLGLDSDFDREGSVSLDDFADYVCWSNRESGRLRGAFPNRRRHIPETMPTPWRRGVYDKVEYVVVERDGVREEGETVSEEPTATINRILRRSHVRRGYPSPTDVDYESDDNKDDDLASKATMTTTIPTIVIPSGPPAVRKPSQLANVG